VTLNLLELSCLDDPNTSEKYRFIDFVKKPIEIYVFIDPLCPDSWLIEPYIRKLSVEYGRFFTIRPVISSHPKVVGDNTNMLRGPTHKQWRVNRSQISDNTLFFPSVSLAIKAAELQGKNAGRNFLRKVQENFFLKSENIADLEILMQCAEDVALDMSEFKKDLHSASVQKAFQCDLKMSNEMDVKETPTIVFFSQFIEDQCIKLSGINTYDIYVFLLKRMLQSDPRPAKKPPIEEFLAYYDIIHNKELAIIYDMTLDETERTLKKLQLKQTVKKVFKKNETFWKYNKKT